MSEWTGALLVVGARVLAILGLALLITTLMWRASASARHFVWTLAAAAILLVPAISLLVPEWRVLPRWERAQPAAVPAAVFVSTAPEPVVAPADAPTPALAPTPVTAAPAPPADQSSLLPLGLLGLWAVVAASLLLRLAVGAWRMRQVAAGAERVWSGPVNDALQAVARELGISRPVRLFMRADAMPITWGFIYPAVLLPDAACKWRAARLDPVLRHELAHVLRADAFTQLLADIACALHWYNPLAWYMCARLRMEREHACDDLVLTGGAARPSEYAEELLGLARAYHVQRAGAHAAMAMARPSSLRVRLAAVLDAGRSRARVSRRAAFAAAAAALLLLLPVAGLAPARAIPVDERVTQDPERAVVAEPSTRAATAPAAEVSYSYATAAPAVLAQQGTTCLTRRGDTVRNMSTNVNDDTYRISYRTNTCEGDVRMDGKLTFNADFTRLTGISRGGYLRMEEEYDRETRRLEIEPSGNGLAYTWSVNGRERPYDAEAQAWGNAVLLSLFRRVGFMAEERALAILQRQGIDGVVTEVGLLEADHAQSKYLTVALKHGNPSPARVQSLLQLAGKVLESDYALASLLSAVAGDLQFNAATSDSFLNAARSLESDHYRHQVLSAVLKRGELTPAQIATVLEQTRTLGSDHYRTQILTSVAAKQGLNASVRSAYLRATREMGSDHYRGQALRSLMNNRSLTAAELAEVIEAAGMISSDHYLTEVLNRIEPAQLESRALQEAWLKAAATIQSDHNLGSLLTRYVNARDLEPAQVQFVLRAARGIESDHQLAELLKRIATRFTLEGATRDQFMEVLETIQSSHYYGQVSAVVLRKR